MLNPSDAEQRLELEVGGVSVAAGGRLWRLAPPTVDAAITVGQKPGVEVREQALSSVPDAVVAPPFSVSIYSFAVVSPDARPGAGS